MHILKSPTETRDRVRKWQREGLSVGFVPTMGALHEGHLSLVRASVSECDRTVVSVFVNPAQFSPTEDLSRYPRRLEADSALVAGAGADLLFAPTDELMYPPDFCTYVVPERLTERLCGAFRPGHFRGVATVVAKLFNIVPADRAFFGRKDYQQCVVIRQMVADLNFPVVIRVMPTVRERDGLAMSSRNEYLSPAERVHAVCLYNALMEARRLFERGETSANVLIERMREVIARYPDAQPQYIEIIHPCTLEPVGAVFEGAIGALAVFVGGVRLIDNMPFGVCDDIFVSSRPAEA
jgi:pantoate--beta-alanine ligase